VVYHLLVLAALGSFAGVPPCWCWLRLALLLVRHLAGAGCAWLFCWCAVHISVSSQCIALHAALVALPTSSGARPGFVLLALPPLPVPLPLPLPGVQPHRHQ
jgi:hypothetical protein